MKVLDIKCLYECLNFEANLIAKVCNFLCLYRSPSQIREPFETFADNLELNLDALTNNNPFLNITIGDFNWKTTNWYKNGTTPSEGLKIDVIISQFGLQQLVKEQTHLTQTLPHAMI